MSKINVAVVFGGKSSEHKVSRASANSLVQNIDSNIYNTVPIAITKTGEFRLADLASLAKSVVDFDYDFLDCPKISWPVDYGDQQIKIIEQINSANSAASSADLVIDIDVVFPIIHGSYGEDGKLQGLLEMSGLPYVGCQVAASALAADKELTKALVAAEGVPIVDYRVLSDFDYQKKPEKVFELAAEISYPLYVKPARAGSSFGVSRVKNVEQLAEAVRVAFAEDSKILIEKAVVGSEVEFAILGDSKDGFRVSAPVQIKLEQGDYFDYQKKYAKDSEELYFNPNLSDSLKARLTVAVEKIIAILGLRHLSRIDFFVVGEEFYLNEVNTVPGFTTVSSYPKSWQLENLSYQELVTELINLALKDSVDSEVSFDTVKF